MSYMASIKKISKRILIIAMAVATVAAFTPAVAWSGMASAAAANGSGTKADPYILSSDAGSSSYTLSKPSGSQIYVQFNNSDPVTVTMSMTSLSSDKYIYGVTDTSLYIKNGSEKTFPAGPNEFRLGDTGDYSGSVSLSVTVADAGSGGGSDYTKAEELDFDSGYTAEMNNVAMTKKSDVHWYKMVVPERMTLTYTPKNDNGYNMTLYKSDGSTEIGGCYRTGGNDLAKLALDAGTYYFKKMCQSVGTYSFRVQLEKYIAASGAVYDENAAQGVVGGSSYKFTITSLTPAGSTTIFDSKNIDVEHDSYLGSARLNDVDGGLQVTGVTGEKCGYGTVTLLDKNAGNAKIATIKVRVTPPAYKKMYLSATGTTSSIKLTMKDISAYATHYRVYIYDGGQWVSKGDRTRIADKMEDNSCTIKGLKASRVYKVKIAEVYKSGSLTMVGPACEEYSACTAPGGKVKVIKAGGFRIEKRLEHVDPSNILSDTFTTYSSTGYVKVKKVSGATKYQVRAESTPAESKSTKITGVVFKNARRSLAAAKGTKKIYVYAMKTTSDGAEAYGPATAKTITIR
jgi:hypothetical protein